LAELKSREGKLFDVAFWGLRAAVGVIFIAHGAIKFQPGFVQFVTGTLGFPPEMQIPIALAELVSGILLIVGILTRLSASLLSIIILGAIFYVKQAANLTGRGGYELDLILLAACLVIIVGGPGRISISHLSKKISGVLR